MKHFGDITKLNGAELPAVDIITGGSPCQDLSVAGKRAGLVGDSSGLFMEQIRIIKEMREYDRANRGTTEHIRPRYMVWENVPGAFSSNDGEDFRTVLEKTAKVADKDATIPRPQKKWGGAGTILGRGWSIAWRTHDAQFWGVLQRRRRICLVADFDGDTAGKILFDVQLRGEAEYIETFKIVSGDREESKAKVPTIRESVPRDIEQGKQEKERTSCDIERGVGAFSTIVIENHPADSRVRICKDSIFQTLSSRMGTGGGNVPMVMNVNSEKENDAVVRRITPTECERLQGYPDGWTDIGDWVDSKGKTHKGDADSPRYKALGNSIALPFWQWLAERMVNQLKKDGGQNPTMASLFDGIGGFPLVYSRCGCKPIWASEVEEFPIAVTKIRFSE